MTEVRRLNRALLAVLCMLLSQRLLYNVKIFFVYRSAAEFKGNCKTVKLFAKHMKVMLLLSSRDLHLGWTGEGGRKRWVSWKQHSPLLTIILLIIIIILLFLSVFSYVTIFRVEIGLNSELLMWIPTFLCGYLVIYCHNCAKIWGTPIPNLPNRRYFSAFFRLARKRSEAGVELETTAASPVAGVSRSTSAWRLYRSPEKRKKNK